MKILLILVLIGVAIPAFYGSGKRNPSATGPEGPGLVSARETAPASIVYLSPYWNPQVLVVGKKVQKLFLYGVDGNLPRLTRALNVTTGKLVGDKTTEGDLKTPEGIYFPMEKFDGRRLGDEYGVLAVTLDYPNPYDRLLGKGGSGIWIHATNEPLRSLTPKMTRGCVVLSNGGMLELDKHIRVGETPVVIAESLEILTRQEHMRLRREIFRVISGWLACWKNRDIHGYLSYYAETFQSGNGWDLTRYREHRKKVFRNADPFSVRLSPVAVVQCPKYLVAVLNQQHGGERDGRFGRKLLYLHREEGLLKIVSEHWAPIDSSMGWGRDVPEVDDGESYGGQSADGTVGQEGAGREPAAPGRESVRIQKFQAEKQSRKDRIGFGFEVLNVDFRRGESLDVRIAFILKGRDRKGRNWYTSYPAGVTGNSFAPQRFSLCERHTLQRLLRIEGQVRLPRKDGLPRAGRVFVYGKDGMLLAQAEIDLSGGGEG